MGEKEPLRHQGMKEICQREGLKSRLCRRDIGVCVAQKYEQVRERHSSLSK